MKILSHIHQTERKTKKSTQPKPERSLSRGFAKVGNGNTRPEPINEVELLKNSSAEGGSEQSLESHLDYLRIKKIGLSPEALSVLTEFISKDFVTEMDQYWSPGRGAIGYPNKLIASRGVRGGFSVDNETGMIDLMIDIPGEYFEGKSVVGQWRLCKGLKSHFQVRATRIDVAIDDPNYSQIPIQEMVAACEEGHNFGFKRVGYHASGECGDRQSETRTFGSRESGKFVRVYDHDEECLRFEAEFKRGYANPIFEKFAELERPEGMSDPEWEKELQKHLASMAVGAIDFRDRGDRVEKTRAGVRDSVRLPFYQDFIDLLQAVHYRIKLIKPARSIVKTFEWVKRQCAPVLSMFREGLGSAAFHGWLTETLNDARPRIDNVKEIWIKEIQSNPKMYVTR